MTTAHLNRIGTAVPAFDVHRTFVDFAAGLLPSERHRALFDRMVERGGIEHRFSPLHPRALPMPAGLASEPIEAEDFYRRGNFPTTGERMRAYEHSALDLALNAVENLDLQGREDEVTHLVVVSCTGFYAPGLDLQLVERLGLDSSVERTVVGFMGCYAGINALRLARHIVRSEPSARVLVVCLELCTLHFQETPEIEQILSFLVFGDGCAAALVTADREGLSLDRFRTLLAPEDPGLITWTIGDSGFDMVLSGKVPGAVGRALAARGPDLFGNGSPDDVDLYAVHPGGRSVLDAVENALELPAEKLAASRGVLRSYGNMSSATILFVLASLMSADPAPDRRGLAMAFGPGLTAETLQFRTA
jgi:alpha-pyrone synthase